MAKIYSLLLVAEVVSVQAVAVLPANLPTGMEQRRKQAGELASCYSDLNHREFLASCHTIERGCYSDTPLPRLPFVQIVRLQKPVDILLTIPRHWCQPKRNTFRVTLVNRQCDSVFLQMALCLCSSPQCLTSFACILCQFVIEGGTLDC